MTKPAITNYDHFLHDLKTRIRAARTRAALAVNRELVLLYWQIGLDILERQEREGWGAKVIERLANDLRHEFPDMKGFSPRNLKYMRKFAESWTDEEFVQQSAAQIPWFHNCVLLDKVSSRSEREWYIHKAFEHGWSRDILAMQIETRLFHRQGKAVSNFADTLPPLQSDLAQQTLKDPYLFDFLGLGNDAQEREVERELVKHITSFLLELGAGFSYVGRQVPLEVEGEDFFIDLLFYHLKLRCYVVIELKATKFKPEYAGKLNFYLSAVDATMRHESDNPSIGLILCKDRKGLIAEYALKDISKPVGVSEYQLVAAIPENLKGSLPTVEELEAEFSDNPENDSGTE
ncbi:PDDEXK nuclease domain-containing protein [Geobacter argillaceus]|uniref:Putative nuclease of restriction endonuclease-like (RecB) superfamily n=1 Tax=Geobacter argillaceus TaxID=345631 RepID=A0A562VMH2_9BACT|nr:PDDEXK nuclease domain-containing protein [Geobacter argillaceus]TWJ18974.1 putative nuclease of restriction endonuclease-like (RecB) superfamily [Geobacter argillaceus]